MVVAVVVVAEGLVATGPVVDEDATGANGVSIYS